MGISGSKKDRKHKITPLSIGIGLAIIALWIFGEVQLGSAGGNHDLGLNILVALGLGAVVGPILFIRKRGLGLLIFLIGLFQGVTIPSKLRSGAQRDLMACKFNLKEIGTTLESYSKAHGGEFPSKLSQIYDPESTADAPVCPVGETRYSYQLGFGLEEGNHESGLFLLHCTGTNHSEIGIPEDYPQYDNLRGLLERED